MAPKVKRSLADLKEEQRLLNQQIASNREALAAAERAERDAADKSGGFHLRVTPGKQAIALVLCSFAGVDVSPAVDFIFGSVSVPKGSEELAMVEIRKLVEDWVLSMEPRELANLAAEATTPNKYAFSMACRYYPKWELAQWVSAKNEDTVAPTTRQCMHQHDVFLRADYAEDGGSDAVRMYGRGRMTARDRMFATRWRRRMGLRLGVPKINEPSSLDESRKKAQYICYFV
jgi:hypothetical protein